jgi:hypothetical protein
MVNLLKQFFKKILNQIAAKKHLQTNAQIQSQGHRRRRQHTTASASVLFPTLWEEN